MHAVTAMYLCVTPGQSGRVIYRLPVESSGVGYICMQPINVAVAEPSEEHVGLTRHTCVIPYRLEVNLCVFRFVIDSSGA